MCSVKCWVRFKVYDIYIDLVSGTVTKSKNIIYIFIHRDSQISFFFNHNSQAVEQKFPVCDPEGTE
jgi:hypothetical protein